MEKVVNINDCENLTDNKVVFEKSDNCDVIIENSEILFKGRNNTLYIENGVKIKGSRIAFEGDNNIVYLCKSNYNYILGLTLYNSSAFYMGEGNYINGKMNIILSERKHIFIGDYGLFSFGIWMRLADPHLIYGCDTLTRKNPTKSIFIGDHVWIGQGAMILKGTHIGSGSIIGAMSVVSGKEIPSNTAYAGNPAKQVSKGVFFDKQSVHNFNQKQTEKYSKYDDTKYTYEYDKKSTLDFNEIDQALDKCNSSEEKLEFLHKIRSKNDKNRFYIKPSNNKKKFSLFR